MRLPQRPRRHRLLQYPAAADPTLPAALDEARHRGHRGGIIARHRSLINEPRPRGSWVANGAIVVAVLAGWLLAFDRVTLAWTWMLDFWQAVFGLGGYALRIEYAWGLRVPYVGFPSAAPGWGLWIAGAAFTVALLVGSLLVPRRYLPIATGLRVIAFFQLGAQVFFGFWPERFPYSGPGYVHGMLIAGLAFMTLVPFLLGLTYFVFDVGWSRKLGLALLILGHLFLFVPLQYMAHAVIISHLSVLFLPILFFVFGLPLDVLLFIGFYAWGASWRSLWAEPRPRRRPEALGGAT